MHKFSVRICFIFGLFGVSLGASSPAWATPYDFNAQWQALNQSERVLEDQMKIIVEKNFTADDIIARATLDNTQYIREADFFLNTFQTTLDAHIQMQFEFFIEGTYAIASNIKTILSEQASPHESAQLERAFKKIETNYNDYQTFKVEYGRPKDWLRTRSIRQFFRSTRKFMATFESIENDLIGTGHSSSQRLRDSLAFAYRYFKIGVNVLPKGVTVFRELRRNTRPENGYAPFIDAVMRSFQTIARVDGYTVEVAGREHIPRTNIPNVVNIIVPTHRDELFDQFVTAAIGTTNMMIFGAPDHFAGRHITDLLDKSHSFIVIGRGADKPIKKVINNIHNGISNTLYIYPEGNLPAGIMETRPPREKFIKGLYMSLIREGFTVNFIPLTNINAGRFLGYYEIPEQKNQRAVVHSPITHDTLQAMLATGDEQAINRLIRQVWLETMITNEHTVVGQMRASTLLDSLSSYLFERSEIAKTFIRENFIDCEHMLSL